MEAESIELIAIVVFAIAWLVFIAFMCRGL